MIASIGLSALPFHSGNGIRVQRLHSRGKRRNGIGVRIEFKYFGPNNEILMQSEHRQQFHGITWLTTHSCAPRYIVLVTSSVPTTPIAPLPHSTISDNRSRSCPPEDGRCSRGPKATFMPGNSVCERCSNVSSGTVAVTSTKRVLSGAACRIAVNCSEKRDLSPAKGGVRDAVR